MTEIMTDKEHFILSGRVVGKDEGWVDCICGWHYEGTVKESRAAGDRHLRAYEQNALDSTSMAHLRIGDPTYFGEGEQ